MIKFTTNKKSFLSSIGAKISRLTDASGKRAAKQLMSAMIEATPIDTGYARSRWTFKVNDDYVVRYNVTGKGLLFNEFKYTISNDTSYIVYLNRGSSKQAPAFFIEQTILAQGFRFTA